jgi:hypothetical protein
MKTRKNMIMEDSLFIKLVYSDENMVMNSIYLEFPVVIQEVNRNMIFFQGSENQVLLKRIASIEQELLLYYKRIHECNKKLSLTIVNQLERCQFKFNIMGSTKMQTVSIRPNDVCVLKISGIWESTDTIGLNCKWYFTKTE